MGKRQPVDQISPRKRRIGSLAIAGALPLVAAFGNTGNAAAETVSPDESQPAMVENQVPQAGAQPGVTLDTPFGQVTVPVPQALADGAQNYLENTTPTALGVEGKAREAMAAEPGTMADPAAAPVLRVGRNSSTGVRDIPNAPLAPVDTQNLRSPDPLRAAEVAPIAAPEGKLRFGDTQVDIPTWLTAEQAAQVNAVAAAAEAELAQTLDSAGFEPSRSDRIAAQTVGTAAVGAAVGVGVAAPVEVAGMVMGGFVGAMVGTPFAPAGWVFGPAIGATAGASLIAIPAATVGATIGAAVGAANGFMAPATEGAPVTEAAPAADENVAS